MMSAEPHSQYDGTVEEPSGRCYNKTKCIVHQKVGTCDSIQSLLASGQAPNSVDKPTLLKVFSASIKRFATTKLREKLEKSNFAPEQHDSMIDRALDGMSNDDWLTNDMMAALRIGQYFGSADWSKGSRTCLLLTLRTERVPRESNAKSCLGLECQVRPAPNVGWWTPLEPVSGGSLQSPPTACQDTEDVLRAIFTDAGSTDPVDLRSTPMP